MGCNEHQDAEINLPRESKERLKWCGHVMKREEHDIGTGDGNLCRPTLEEEESNLEKMVGSAMIIPSLVG